MLKFGTRRVIQYKRGFILLYLITFSTLNLTSQIPPSALLRLLVNYDNNLDECIVYLHPLATDTFDSETYDSPKLLSSTEGVPNVFTWSQYFDGWVKLSANALAFPITTCHIIPVGVKATASGNYSVTVSEIYGFDSANVNISFIDYSLLDSVSFDTINSIYNFTANIGDSIRGRFYLRICPDIPVDVNDPTLAQKHELDCSKIFTENLFFSQPQEAMNLRIFSLQGQTIYVGSHVDFLKINSFNYNIQQPYIVQLSNSSGTCFRKVFFW